MKTTISFIVLGLFTIITIVIAGCTTGGSSTELACGPGRVQSCPCGGDLPDSVQTCEDDGASWSECECDIQITDSDSDDGTTDADTDSGPIDTDSGTGTNDTDTETGDTESLCDWDSDDEAANANALAYGAEESGFLCPIGDQDWYSFITGVGDELVTVSLVVDGPVSPIDPSYAIWDAAGENLIASPDAADAAGPDETLAVTHSIAPGDYRLVVGDRASDAQDTQHSYLLTVTSTTEPDSNEPNNDSGTATPVSDGSNVAGYISFEGDEDWYEFTTPDDYLVRATLTMEVSAIQPRMRVEDTSGNVLGELTNLNGTLVPTDMELLQALDTPGNYFLIVSDDSDGESDASVQYSVVFELVQDPDHANEPNDHPSTATTLNTATCGGSFVTTSHVGFIGSQGDVDWYRVPLSGCSQGVIEVDVTRAGTVPENFNFSAQLVRGVAGETCALDQECLALSTSCTEHMHCTRIGNTCLAEGKCSGAGLCLPGAECGAVLLSETAHPSTPDVLKLSAPLMSTLDQYDEIYISVSDGDGNAYDFDNSYTLTVRTIDDPDTRENASVYTAGAATYDDAPSAHRANAIPIAVHDCRIGDCCGAGTWEPGYLSYQYDQDWFEFDHPCPGLNCMVDIHWRFEGTGPTEFMIHRYHGGSLFGNNISSATDSTNPATLNGPETDVFGNGVECSFAWEDHSGPYHLMVRDTRAVSAGNQTGGFWEWSTTQRFSVCVELVADGCLDPCCMYVNGCGAPPEGGSCP